MQQNTDKPDSDPNNDPNNDPWASLADSLGVSGSSESRPEPPAQGRPQPPRAEKRKTVPAGGKQPAKPASAWSSLASDLGLEPPADGVDQPASKPAPKPRPAAEARAFEPRRAEPARERPSREGREFGQGPAAPAGVERRKADDFERAGDDGQPDVGERDSDRGEGRAEGRARRRRGRRGGRRRSGRGEGGEGRLPDRPDTYGDRGRSDVRSEIGTERGELTDAADIDEIDDVERAADEGIDRGPDEPGEPALEDSGEPRRRRRRRGRRGGRRRRGGEEGSADETARPTEPGARGADDHDDEPLPTGYGMPARRPSSPEARERPRGEQGRSDERRPEERRGEEGRGEAAGGERTRRRRRRGGRRRSSETAGDERPAKSRGRGSRRDFAPVAGSFDEDDEGLEFLGLDEAAKPRSRREGAADEEDVLVESGLAEVLDVPSWVEAIGIVIAGNLDARSRSREDRSR